MLLDMFGSNNNILVNIKAAQVLGLKGAVYAAVIIDIYQKALAKNKLTEDGFFKVDRTYICNRSTLTMEEQYVIDSNWKKISLLDKQADNPDLIRFDINTFIAILTNEDMALLADISKKVKIKSPRGIRETKRQAICNNLKNNIQCSNYELLTALRDWVDTIFANPSNYLSKSSVVLFQNTLNQYTQGDLDLALRLVKIAIAQGYKDCNWAISVYEKSEEIKAKTQQTFDAKLPRVTEQKRATEDSVSKDAF